VDVFTPLGPFLFICLIALFYAVNGQVERYDPKTFFKVSILFLFDYSEYEGRTVSPIEVRSALAIGFLAILLLGWLLGDALITSDPIERRAEIQSQAALERIRIVRYFAPDLIKREEAIPLPPPWNLLSLLFVDFPLLVCHQAGKRGQAFELRWKRLCSRAIVMVIKWQLVLIDFVGERRYLNRT